MVKINNEKQQKSFKIEFKQIKSFEEVKKDGEDYKILKVSMTTCPPCKAYKSNLEAAEFNKQLTVYELNGPDDMEFCKKYDIKAVPLTMLFDKANEVLVAKPGQISIEDFKKLINENTEEKL